MCILDVGVGWGLIVFYLCFLGYNIIDVLMVLRERLDNVEWSGFYRNVIFIVLKVNLMICVIGVFDVVICVDGVFLDEVDFDVIDEMLCFVKWGKV